MRTSLAVALSALLAGPTLAAELNLKVQIPRLDVAEYHRPYVAIWLEKEDNSVAANLAVWYDVKMKNHEGGKWLKDIRQWWRRSGRELEMPVDGISGPTRAAGEHSLVLRGDQAPLAGLPAGKYRLVVEAAREVGGRELAQIDFEWPPTQAQQLSAQGEHELGAIALELNP